MKEQIEKYTQLFRMSTAALEILSIFDKTMITSKILKIHKKLVKEFEKENPDIDRIKKLMEDMKKLKKLSPIKK